MTDHFRALFHTNWIFTSYKKSRLIRKLNITVKPREVALLPQYIFFDLEECNEVIKSFQSNPDNQLYKTHLDIQRELCRKIRIEHRYAFISQRNKQIRLQDRFLSSAAQVLKVKTYFRDFDSITIDFFERLTLDREMLKLSTKSPLYKIFDDDKKLFIAMGFLTKDGEKYKYQADLKFFSPFVVYLCDNYLGYPKNDLENIFVHAIKYFLEDVLNAKDMNAFTFLSKNNYFSKSRYDYESEQYKDFKKLIDHWVVEEPLESGFVKFYCWFKSVLTKT